MFTLYFSKGSSALAPHILLEEIGADYKADERSIPQGAHLTTEFLAVNPKGRVPALLTPDGIITENPAILWYIGEAFPEAELLPTDLYSRARIQELNAYICSTAHVAFAHKGRGQRWSDDPAVIEGMKAKVADNLRECATLVETQYLTGRWALGDTYSISDPYLFLLHRWMKQADLDIAEFPKLNAHRKSMLARDGTMAALSQHGI
ncbi:glutathione S-transferase family protein [Lutimaribacter marinistellae]|uniref:Glutathione S-transferase family protein n=1 Tax=Lutimaribacter marinistellae TaxID=1820329 RepID=A0ABV7TLT3_9RHOB